MKITKIFRLKKENLRLKSEIDMLKSRLYDNCRSMGCTFCEHGMIIEHNNQMYTCCELEQQEFCGKFVKKSLQ